MPMHSPPHPKPICLLIFKLMLNTSSFSHQPFLYPLQPLIQSLSNPENETVQCFPFSFIPTDNALIRPRLSLHTSNPIIHSALHPSLPPSANIYWVPTTLHAWPVLYRMLHKNGFLDPERMSLCRPDWYSILGFNAFTVLVTLVGMTR